MRMRLMPARAAAPRRQQPQDPYRGAVSKTDAQAALQDEPRLTEPRFTPGWRDPLRVTGQIPELALERPGEPGAQPALVRPYMPSGHPLDPRTPVEPAASGVVEDSLPPLPSGAPAAAAPANLRPDPVLYCEPGWAGTLMNLRLRNGEWENVHLIAERGWTENAADEAAQRFRTRLGISRGARQLCAALGQPEMAGALLRRVRELEAAAGGAA